jgi:hypothetical protein
LPRIEAFDVRGPNSSQRRPGRTPPNQLGHRPRRSLRRSEHRRAGLELEAGAPAVCPQTGALAAGSY